MDGGELTQAPPAEEPVTQPVEEPENPPAERPEGPAGEEAETPPEWALTPERMEQLLAYCKLTELADDPEVAALIPVLYSAAVGYMDNAGVSLPEEGTPRRAQYDLCVNHIVLDAYERRETAMVATVVADNPAFRRLINQLKQTEPEVGL